MDEPSPGYLVAKEILLKSIIPLAVVVLGMTVGWLFYPRQPTEELWATVEELHARWDVESQSLRVSLVFTKHVECPRVVVSKHLIPVENDVVLGTNPIPLTGTLAEQIQNIEVHKSAELWDEAWLVNTQELKYEEYQLVIVVNCESGNGEFPLEAEARSTMPVRKLITIGRSRMPGGASG